MTKHLYVQEQHPNRKPVTVSSSGLTYYNLVSSGAKFDLVKSSIDELRRRLANDTDCMRWLQSGTNGGAATPTLLAKLDEFTRVASRIESDGRGAPEIAATANDLRGIAIVINGEGAFFYARGNTATTSDRVAILAHELAHVTGAPGFRHNDESSAVRDANESLLREKCAKTLASE